MTGAGLIVWCPEGIIFIYVCVCVLQAMYNTSQFESRM